MSKDDRQTSTEKAKHESVSQKYRSPCTDAHCEAFILRSSWTVGNLYAANLNLGQSYVKQVRDIEKQRKVWLSRKEKEQETMQRRFEALKRQAKHYFHSDSLADGREVAKNRRFPRQRAATLGACSQIASLEKLDLFERRGHFRNNRTTSQPARHGFHSGGLTEINSSDASFKFQTSVSRSGLASTCTADCALTSLRRSGSSLRRTTSVLSAYGKSATSTERQNLSANLDLIPRWLPANLRSKDIRGKTV